MDYYSHYYPETNISFVVLCFVFEQNSSHPIDCDKLMKPHCLYQSIFESSASQSHYNSSIFFDQNWLILLSCSASSFLKQWLSVPKSPCPITCRVEQLELYYAWLYQQGLLLIRKVYHWCDYFSVILWQVAFFDHASDTRVGWPNQITQAWSHCLLQQLLTVWLIIGFVMNLYFSYSASDYSSYHS